METVDVRGTIPVMPGASEQYRSARERLRLAEVRMRVALSDLFADGKPELVVYHLMYWANDDEFCAMCSMWIDGLDAVAPHIERRANFAVATRAPLSRLQEWAEKRAISRAIPARKMETARSDRNGFGFPQTRKRNTRHLCLPCVYVRRSDPGNDYLTAD